MINERTRTIFITGLINAHAMEKQALAVMRPQVERIENYPGIAARLRSHVAQTEQQILRLEEILTNLGEDHSRLKDMAMSVTGSLAAIGHSLPGDDVLKKCFANVAFENYEIAAYTSLVVAAEATGHTSSLTALKQNLDEEIDMAHWLMDSIRPTTIAYVHLAEAANA